MKGPSEMNTGQYLTFRLGDEVFGVPISQVQEVMDYTTITRVPRAPSFMRGVINLRGAVVPVADIRIKFHMPATKQSINTCIIVLEVNTTDGLATVGILADQVLEVIEVSETEIAPSPKLGTKLKAEYLGGLGKRGESFFIILNIENIFRDKTEAEACLVNESENMMWAAIETKDEHSIGTQD